MSLKDVEESIKHSIRKNGFPEKIVNLPFKPVYDHCKRNDVHLAEVLKRLEEENILGKTIGNSIQFRSPDKPAPRPEPLPNATPEMFGAGGTGETGDQNPLTRLQSLGREQLAKMNPEQLAEIKNLVENMSDEDKKNYLKLFSDLYSPGR